MREIIPVTDIQYIGSATVKNIQAKSVIDIIVGVEAVNNLVSIDEKSFLI